MTTTSTPAWMKTPLAYLALANQVIHDLRPDAVTIAEDVSGMPGLAAAAGRTAAVGFDYRFAMGVPDYWIQADQGNPRRGLAHRLLSGMNSTNRRPDERTISYAESHDQALVGDQTLIFRLMEADMYDHMHLDDVNWRWTAASRCTR